ncbi:hypothetical protein ACFL2E_00095 [Thermodesulfobacteriota bacterium]
MMLKCVLLDANIIIESYVLGAWEKLIGQTEIFVSSVIINDKARFYSKADGEIPEPINLKKLTSEGKIKEVAATAQEVKGFRDKFDSVFVEGLHDGEAECLALMMLDRVTKRLRPHYRDVYFKQHIKIGSQNLITGQGLKR